MTLSLAGAIGAALGAYLGWIDGKIVSGLLSGQAEKKRSEGAHGSFLVRYQAPLRAVSFGLPLIAFPVIGYWAGVSFAG